MAIRLTLRRTCRRCGTRVHITVNSGDWINWFCNGYSVHQAFPYLPAGKREVLISRICTKCFDAITQES